MSAAHHDTTTGYTNGPCTKGPGHTTAVQIHGVKLKLSKHLSVGSQLVWERQGDA